MPKRPSKRPGSPEKSSEAKEKVLESFDRTAEVADRKAADVADAARKRIEAQDGRKTVAIIAGAVALAGAFLLGRRSARR